MRRTIVGTAAALAALIVSEALGTSAAQAQYVGIPVAAPGAYRVRVNPNTGVMRVRGRAFAPAVVDTYVAPTTYVTTAPVVTSTPVLTTTRVIETAPVVTTTRIVTPTVTTVPVYSTRSYVVPAPVLAPRVYVAPVVPTIYTFPF
ncbi:MAG: hypothetical protein U0794_09195 [Isosphaeraceae bacterium]